MGRAAIRAVACHPGLALVAVITSTPEQGRPRRGRPGRGPGRDARRRGHRRRRRRARRTGARGGRLHGVGRHPARRRGRRHRPRPARRRRGRDPGALRALRPPQRARRADRVRCSTRPRRGACAVRRERVDPGWGNDMLPVLVSGLAGTIDQVRCREIFDYTTYDQPDSVRYLVGMGEPMDYEPPMVAPGGADHGVGRPGPDDRPGARRRARRDPRDARRAGRSTPTSPTRWALFVAGTQGALRFEVQGIVDGEPADRRRARHPHPPRCAPTGPCRPTAATAPTASSSRAGRASRSSLEATDEGGNRAAGGNATAANRLVNAIPWLTRRRARPVRRPRRTASRRRRPAATA